MYSSEDLERFYFQYQTEAMPNGISIEQFCSRNKVPYNIFYKWYKDTRTRIVEVKVDGMPSSVQENPKREECRQERLQTGVPAAVRILVELRMTNGLHISQKNLSYQELKQLIEKLEGLCWA
ncbi:MAG TPA: hypothetical protein DEQ84_01070 [Prevotellaceae bacterium]|nr:hypothetical protein [Prevotellaceae bacterium]